MEDKLTQLKKAYNKNKTRVRNREIYSKYLKGESYESLAESYGLTKSRIYQICRTCERIEERSKIT